MFPSVFRDLSTCVSHVFTVDLRFLETFKRVKEDGEREDDLYYVDQAKAGRWKTGPGRLLLQIPCLFGGDDPGPQEDHVCENGPSGAGVQGLIGSHIF